VTKLTDDESGHQWPQLLPGGKTLIFSATRSGGSQIYAQSIETGERRPLVQGLGARYLPSGHLVFLQGGTVMAATSEHGVVNPYSQHWRVPNLFVLGASTFPNQGAANPTPTILAMTYRAADAIVDRYLKKPGMLA